MTEPRPLKVFLCHASADKPAVRILSHRLAAEGWIDPWLDEEKLSFGQHWTIVIEEALDAADIVLIFLSRNSVQKEGFVQRELSYAWDLSLEKPRNVIFLIPFRLDDCEVPRYLSSRQWGDYFGDKEESTYQILLRSLKQRHEQKLRLEAEEQKQRETANREKMEREAKEKTERDAAEKLALEKAERENAELVRKIAEREAAREKVVRDSAKKVAREKAAREKAERETAEKAKREKAERKAAEKGAREKAERDAAQTKSAEKPIQPKNESTTDSHEVQASVIPRLSIIDDAVKLLAKIEHDTAEKTDREKAEREAAEKIRREIPEPSVGQNDILSYTPARKFDFRKIGIVGIILIGLLLGGWGIYYFIQNKSLVPVPTSSIFATPFFNGTDTKGLDDQFSMETTGVLIVTVRVNTPTMLFGQASQGTISPPAPSGTFTRNPSHTPTSSRTPTASRTPTVFATLPPGTCGHALDAQFGTDVKFVIHRAISGDNLEKYVLDYQTSLEAIQAVNFSLHVPLLADWVIVIPVGTTDMRGIPPFEPYQASGESMSLDKLALQLNTDATSLRKYNVFDNTCKIFVNWLLIPR